MDDNTNLTTKKAANKPADDEKKQRAAEQFSPTNVDEVPQSLWGYFDNCAKLLAGVAFVCWMIQEWIIPKDRIFLLIAIVFGLADVFYLVFHKILQRNRGLIVFGWAIYALIVVAIAKNSAGYDPIVTPIILASPQAEYIEGTQITHKRMADSFPFGYAVIYLSENKRFRYEVFKNGMADWILDWDKVEIKPDVSTGTVTWNLPSMSVTGPKINLKIEGPEIQITPFTKGITRFFIAQANIPALYIGVLSNNQRSPIFVMGFKIPSPGEK